MEDVGLDIEQEISNSVDNACTNEARTPEQDWEMWVLGIQNRLKDQFQDQIRSPQASKYAHTKHLSINSNDSFPEKFEIGVHVYGRAKKELMWEYVAFLSRWHHFDVNSYLKHMKEMEEVARNHYKETNERHLVRESYSFLQSLMVGSCFLAFALVSLDKANGKPVLTGMTHGTRAGQFEILYRPIMNPSVQTKLDMLSLGNQIPWFAVEAVFTNSNLYKMTTTRKRPIYMIAVSCFDDLYPRANKSKVDLAPIPGFTHLLHIFHWSRTPQPNALKADAPRDKMFSKERFATFYIPSAKDLLESATVLKKLASGFCNAEYSNKLKVSALMQIAPLKIFPYSEKIFSDLLEFEQIRYSHFDCGLPITAYIACMKCLLQTIEDVQLLQKNGIVQNTLKDQQDVLDFVHNLSKNVLKQNDSLPVDLISLSKKVNNHHEERLSREFANFKRQYFPNRWVTFTIAASATLFVLTLIQTIFTVLGYIKS